MSRLGYPVLPERRDRALSSTASRENEKMPALKAGSLYNSNCPQTKKIL
jgi:hypothetical protein